MYPLRILLLGLLSWLILKVEQGFLLRVVVLNSWSLVDNDILLRCYISILILLYPTDLNRIILVTIPISHISRSIELFPTITPLIFPQAAGPILATPILTAPIRPSRHNKTLIDNSVIPAIYFFQISILVLIDIHLFLVGDPFGHCLAGRMNS